MAEKHKYDEREENQVINIIHNEYMVAKTNQANDKSNFEACIDLFDNERVEKEYEGNDWSSNIPIPEFSSEILTQSSIDVSQYFQTRDFVETYVQDPSEEALLAADAAEELINRTLNRRNLYHYQKFVRAKTMNTIGGYTYAECGWEQKNDPEFGIVKDQFWYDVLDPRNVFMDNKYCYSIQEKDWVIIRRERTYEQLKREEKAEGYFNLNLVKELRGNPNTETKRETRDVDEPNKSMTPDNKISKYFDVFKRYGLFWIDKTGKPGIDDRGEIKADAELKELIITGVYDQGKKILIGFNETPYIDAVGNAYRPIFRGLCYIHPTRDTGVGDGHYARPLQIAINDTFNIGNDRVMLATFPTMKGKKYVTDETDTVFVKPNHLIELNEPDDLQELKISDNIAGSMQQFGVLVNKMQQTTAIDPLTMGNMSIKGDPTATEVSGAQNRTNQRTNYKSMTFEYTFLNELYWMIQQMTWQFAKPETGYLLMGDKVINFNPSFEFFYKPLSQSIETEASKQSKIKNLTIILQTIVNSPHPDMPIIFNYILAQIIVLMGDEYVNISDKFLNPEAPLQEGNMGTPENTSQGGGGPSNQYMLPQGNMEVMARENMNV